MSKRSRGWKKVLTSVLAGAFVFAVGCTTANLQAQFANGLRTAMTGVFNLGSAQVANIIFDVDD